MTITFFNINTHQIPDKHLSIEKLTHFTMGIQQLTTAELEQLVDHIMACQECRNSIKVSIAIEKDMAQTENCPGTRTVDLLEKIAEIIHEIDAQNDISAYIDVLEMQGKEAAEHNFPLLANHLKKCRACRSLLEETLTLLHQAEEAGLTDPLF